MTNGQLELIENYNSLRDKTGSHNIAAMLRFCSLFQSDDEELFSEFLQIYKPSNVSNVDKFIELFAKRYDLSTETDMEQILFLFVQNSVNNGVVYHLNSSANFTSIMEQGIGLSAIGLKTEERQDYEMLQASLDSETFRKLEPFVGDKKGSKVYYSCTPILNARYGDRPEWLKELELNSPVLEEGTYEYDLVHQVLDKYDRKYNDAEKVLFILPSPIQLTTDDVTTASQRSSPRDVIRMCFSFLDQKNKFTEKHIPSSSIIAIDLKTCDMCRRGETGEIEIIKPNEDDKKL